MADHGCWIKVFYQTIASVLLKCPCYYHVILWNTFYILLSKTERNEDSCFEVKDCLHNVPCLIFRGLNYILNEVNKKVK